MNNSNQDNNKRIAANTILLTIRMVFVLAIGLYTTRVVLNVLGASDYGIYNVVGGFVAMFAFINTSMSNGIQRFYNFELGKSGGGSLNLVFNTAIRIQMMMALVVLILTETVGLWFLYEKMVLSDGRFIAAMWCFQFSVASLLLSVLQLPFAALVIAHEKMDFYAVLSIIDAVLKLGIAVSLPFFSGDKLVVYGALFLLITIVDTVLYVIYTKKQYPYDVMLGKGNKTLYKEMLSFTGWNFFGSFGGVMRDQGMNLLLNFFFGPVANAARGVAYQVMGACQSFVGNITTASRPQMTRSYAEGNIERSMNIMNSMSKLSFMSILIFALPVVLEIDFILKKWLGEEVPDYTSIFLFWIMAESLVDVFNPPVSFMVHATGKMRRYQVVGTMVSLFALPVAYVFLELGNEPYVVFIVAFVFRIIYQIVSVLILRTLITLSARRYLQDVIFPMLLVVLLSIVMPYFLHVLMNEGWTRLFIVGGVSVISVLISSFFVGLNVNERNLVFSMVASRIKNRKFYGYKA